MGMMINKQLAAPSSRPSSPTVVLDPPAVTPEHILQNLAAQGIDTLKSQAFDVQNTLNKTVSQYQREIQARLQERPKAETRTRLGERMADLTVAAHLISTMHSTAFDLSGDILFLGFAGWGNHCQFNLPAQAGHSQVDGLVFLKQTDEGPQLVYQKLGSAFSIINSTTQTPVCSHIIDLFKPTHSPKIIGPQKKDGNPLYGTRTPQTPSRAANAELLVVTHNASNLPPGVAPCTIIGTTPDAISAIPLSPLKHVVRLNGMMCNGSCTPQVTHATNSQKNDLDLGTQPGDTLVWMAQTDTEGYLGLTKDPSIPSRLWLARILRALMLACIEGKTLFIPEAAWLDETPL